MIRLATGFTLLTLAASTLQAQEHQHSPYADFTSREIKALGPEDVEALRTGQGMGFALAAELNGYPGPRHVLELGLALGLSDSQRIEITRIRDRMQATAIELGQAIVRGERALDQAFAESRIDPSAVDSLTGSIAALQGRLRAVHLQAHLQVTALLTPEQRERYDRLRGYRH